MATRKELIEAVGTRYRTAKIDEKTAILDEFVALTGYHRKHAIRVLGNEQSASEQPRRRCNLIYDEAVRQALVMLWEAWRPCVQQKAESAAAPAYRRDGAARPPRSRPGSEEQVVECERVDD